MPAPPARRIGNAGLEIDGLRIRPTRGFPSCIAAGIVLVGGKWYYEITVVATGAASQLGWADLEFVGAWRDGVGIGDDKCSWAFDGDRAMTWHNGSQRFGSNWKAGDIVGVACDLEARSLSFSLNGRWTRPYGKAFSNIEFTGGLTPGFTAQGPGPEFIVNFGATPLKHEPPAEGYKPVQEWIVKNAPGRWRKKTEIESMGEEEKVEPGKSGDDEMLPVLQVATGGALLRVTSRLQSQTPFLEKKRVSMRASSGSWQVEIDENDNLVYPTARDSTSYPSVVADGVCLVTGRWYYECTVLQAVPRGARCALGWGDRQFTGNWSAGKGVGDGMHSWACISTDGKSDLSARAGGKSTQLRGTLGCESCCSAGFCDEDALCSRSHLFFALQPHLYLMCHATQPNLHQRNLRSSTGSTRATSSGLHLTSRPGS